MKKISLLLILMMVAIINTTTVQAEDYTNFQEIFFEDDSVILLKNYSSEDYKDYYSKTKKRKMFGWRIHVVHKNEPLDFIAETKIKIYNSGTTAITHNIELESEESYKKQISASGEIKIKGSGSKKKFKGSVDSSIKASITTTTTKTSSESYEFNIKVDPRTYVSIVTRGTGEINNGVGSYYFFWVRTKQGGWETFTVLTEYYEIIKERF
jgi:hypothetical protein